MPVPYHPKHAWARAMAYFIACILISHMSGALGWVLHGPLATAEQLRDPQWGALLIVSCVAIFIGYFVVWPRGTLTHGRRRNLVVVATFGMLWGVSEGLLFLSVFLLSQRFIASAVGATAATFFILAAFLGSWHSLYWDSHVAPEHNIPEWNIRKVLFAHIPNLLVTLTFLTLYGNAAIFLLLQATALIASTYFMRFPAFWE